MDDEQKCAEMLQQFFSSESALRDECTLYIRKMLKDLDITTIDALSGMLVGMIAVINLVDFESLSKNIEHSLLSKDPFEATNALASLNALNFCIYFKEKYSYNIKIQI